MLHRVIGFDLDQTLVDSRERIVESFRSAFRVMGLPDAPPDAFTPWFGYPLGEILRRVAPGADEAEFTPHYRHAYDVERPGLAGPMPGARTALECLRDNGFRATVVSAKITHAVRDALEEAGLADLVDTVHGGFFGEGKAVPLREEGVTCYVGDHVADMHAAGLARATGIAVATGAHDEAALREAGAAVVIPSLADLPAAIEQVGR